MTLIDYENGFGVGQGTTHKPEASKQHQRRSGDQQTVGTIECCHRFVYSRSWDGLTKHHHVGFDDSCALRTAGHDKCLMTGLGQFGITIGSVAKNPYGVEFAMQVNHRPAACGLMQAIDILRYECANLSK